MLIIVEGCDKSGKTTLSNALIKKFPGLVIKITDRPKDASPQQRNKIKGHYREVLSLVSQSKKFEFIFLDRFYPSEMVYSVKRGYEAMEDKDLQDIEKVVKSMDHLLVFCNPGKDAIIERIRKEADDYVTEEEDLLMLGRYQHFFERTSLNKIEVDTSKPLDQLIKIIDDKIYEHKRHRQSNNGKQFRLL